MTSGGPLQAWSRPWSRPPEIGKMLSQRGRGRSASMQLTTMGMRNVRAKSSERKNQSGITLCTPCWPSASHPFACNATFFALEQKVSYSQRHICCAPWRRIPWPVRNRFPCPSKFLASATNRDKVCEGFDGSMHAQHHQMCVMRCASAPTPSCAQNALRSAWHAACEASQAPRLPAREFGQPQPRAVNAWHESVRFIKMHRSTRAQLCKSTGSNPDENTSTEHRVTDPRSTRGGPHIQSAVHRCGNIAHSMYESPQTPPHAPPSPTRNHTGKSNRYTLEIQQPTVAVGTSDFTETRCGQWCPSAASAPTETSSTHAAGARTHQSRALLLDYWRTRASPGYPMWACSCETRLGHAAECCWQGGVNTFSACSVGGCWVESLCLPPAPQRLRRGVCCAGGFSPAENSSVRRDAEHHWSHIQHHLLLCPCIGPQGPDSTSTAVAVTCSGHFLSWPSSMQISIHIVQWEKMECTSIRRTAQRVGLCTDVMIFKPVPEVDFGVNA